MLSSLLLSLQTSHSRMELHRIILRILPWVMTTLSANVIHYHSLRLAKEEARRQFQEAAAAGTSGTRRWFPGSDPKEHQLLTFDLMKSVAMRKARYRVKLVRYGCTLVYVVLFYNLLPELSLHDYSPGLGTVEGFVVGVLGGLITLYLNENRLCDVRTCWRPEVDYHSRSRGMLWDGIRVAGALTTPIEDGLFYHSWIYRTLVFHLTKKPYGSFTGVSFLDWSWVACLGSNAAFAAYNGKEWRSSGLAGVLSLWVTSRNGEFLDGILAHTVCRVTISCWVLYTGQRQFW